MEQLGWGAEMAGRVSDAVTSQTVGIAALGCVCLASPRSVGRRHCCLFPRVSRLQAGTCLGP